MSLRLVGGLAGALGPIAFLAVVTVAGSLRAGYDPVSRYVSDLAVGENSWIQAANFVAFGCLVLVFARGLRRELVGDEAAPASTGLLTVTGFGLILLGFFPTDLALEGSTAHGAVHFGASVVTFGALMLAIFVISPQLSRDPRWAAYARYSVINGVAVVGLCLAAVVAAPAADFNGHRAGPLAPWTGLVQRALFVAACAWIAILGFRLLALSRVERGRRPKPSVPRRSLLPGGWLRRRARRARAVRGREARRSPPRAA